MESGHLLMWVLVFLVVFAGTRGAHKPSPVQTAQPATPAKSIRREVMLILFLIALWQIGSIQA